MGTHGTHPTRTRLPVPPCADCGTAEGSLCDYGVRPLRFSAERFGFAPGSKLCKGCYRRALRGTGRPRSPRLRLLEPEPDPREIAPRVALVRAAKVAKEARDLEPILTDAELDAILPPVECRRTRDRLARGSGWRDFDWRSAR